MLLSYRWLTKFTGKTPPPEELAHRLTMSGLEVEGIDDYGMLSGKLVIGRVKSVEKHPEADKLSVCKVDAGQGENLTIVCGAPNVREEMVVVVAIEGAVLPGDFVIKKAKIRGVESCGMMCSGAEIGWSSESDGIMELSDDYPVGELFDCVFDVKPTANRPDCLSAFGVARDVVGLEGNELYAPQVRLRETMDRVDSYAQVTIKDKDACPRYLARMVRNAHVGESPAWLKRAIESAGLRPVNNIVDATNYVLLEYGHPLHAFDLDKVAGKHVIVRRAEAGEELEVIDGRRLQLTEEDLVIADTDRAIALAGVMGGLNSEITESTVNVLIESAYFDPVTIRRTAKRFDLSTDASYRFERGADPRQPMPSVNRAAQLIVDLAGGEVVKGVIEVGRQPAPPEAITMTIPRARTILGCDLAPTVIADKLVHIGFETVRSDREQLVVRPPSYRVDVSRDVDLIEEIARCHGYDNIPETTPYCPSAPPPHTKSRVTRDTIRNSLVASGFSEAINYSFVGRDLLKQCKAPTDRLVEITNPLTVDQAVMRTSLLPSLLQNAQTNQRRGVDDVSLFEVGRLYRATNDGEAPYEEELSLALLKMGESKDASWRRSASTVDIFDMKGAVEHLLTDLGIDNLTVERHLRDDLHPGRSLAFMRSGKAIAIVGELHPTTADAMDLRGRVIVAELSVDALEAAADFTRDMKPIARFPKVDRDLALVVDAAQPADALEGVILGSAGELLEDVRLFDVYEGKGIGKGKKSLAYSLSFRASDRTLRDEDVDEVIIRVIEQLAEKTGAALRSE